VNEAGWREVWARASEIFAQEPSDFQLIVILAGLVLLALVLQALAPLFFLTREWRSAAESVSATIAAPHGIWRKPEPQRAPALNRRRKKSMRKKSKPFLPNVKRSGVQGTLPAPRFDGIAPAPDVRAPVNEPVPLIAGTRASNDDAFEGRLDAFFERAPQRH
jgi:hypothetical protein